MGILPLGLKQHHDTRVARGPSLRPHSTTLQEGSRQRYTEPWCTQSQKIYIPRGRSPYMFLTANSIPRSNSLGNRLEGLERCRPGDYRACSTASTTRLISLYYLHHHLVVTCSATILLQHNKIESGDEQGRAGHNIYGFFGSSSSPLFLGCLYRLAVPPPPPSIPSKKQRSRSPISGTISHILKPTDTPTHAHRAGTPRWELKLSVDLVTKVKCPWASIFSTSWLSVPDWVAWAQPLPCKAMATA